MLHLIKEFDNKHERLKIYIANNIYSEDNINNVKGKDSFIVFRGNELKFDFNSIIEFNYKHDFEDMLNKYNPETVIDIIKNIKYYHFTKNNLDFYMNLNKNDVTLYSNSFIISLYNEYEKIYQFESMLEFIKFIYEIHV